MAHRTKRELLVEGIVKIDGTDFVLIGVDEYLRLGGNQERVTGIPPRQPGDAPVAKRLREARQHAGLKQADLAQRLGRSQTLVSQAESGVARVNERYVAAVLKACGLRKTWGLPRGQAASVEGGRVVGIDPVTMQLVRYGSKRDLELRQQYVWWSNGY